jgi:MFS family permease
MMNDVAYPKYRWFILISLCVVQATAVMALVSPATIIGEISGTIGIDLGMTTQITMVAVQAIIGISAFFGGGAVDHFGPYRVWTGCSFIFVAASLLVPVLGDTLWGMLFIRSMQGVAAGPIMSTIPLVAAQWFPLHERGIVIGFQGATVPLGAIISLNFVPLVFRKTGSWQAALAWMAVFFIISLILSLVVSLGPKPPEKESTLTPEGPGENKGDIIRAFKLTATWAAFLCGLWFSWDVRIFNDVITNYLAVDPPVGAGLGPAGAGIMMSGVNAVFILTAVVSGFMLEKVFRGHLRALVLLGFILPSALWFLIKFSAVHSNILILSACMWIGAFGIALISPLITTFFAKNYPEGIMGTLGGLMIVFNQVGIFIGMAVGSLSISITGRYDIAIYLVGAGAFMGFLSAFMLKEPKVFAGISAR